MENTHTHEQSVLAPDRFARLAADGYPVAARDGVPTVQVPPAVYRRERHR